MDDVALERWSRQVLVPGIDLEGQERLAASTVLVVGCGGLGCPLALYLAAAGVGGLRLVDDDRIELSNLPRQIAFTEADVGRPKAEVLAAAARVRNGHCDVRSETAALTVANAGGLLAGVDLVIDATDSAASRRCIDDATRAAGLPWILGAAVQQSGFWLAFSDDRHEGCYHCLAPDTAAGGGDCSLLGVLGPVVGAVAMAQCIAAIRYLSGQCAPDWGVLNVLDFGAGEQQRLQLTPRPGCERCSP